MIVTSVRQLGRCSNRQPAWSQQALQVWRGLHVLISTSPTIPTPFKNGVCRESPHSDSTPTRPTTSIRGSSINIRSRNSSKRQTTRAYWWWLEPLRYPQFLTPSLNSSRAQETSLCCSCTPAQPKLTAMADPFLILGCPPTRTWPEGSSSTDPTSSYSSIPSSTRRPRRNGTFPKMLALSCGRKEVKKSTSTVVNSKRNPSTTTFMNSAKLISTPTQLILWIFFSSDQLEIFPHSSTLLILILMTLSRRN